MRKVLLATCAVAGALVFSAAPAAAQSPPGIVLDQTIRAAPDSIHLLETVPVDPAHIGSECAVTITGENNASVHPNTDIFIASENEVVALDVERAAGAVTTPAGTLRLADTITINVRLGEDGVFSGGFLRASFACEPPPPPPPPPTTVAAPTTAPNVPVGAEVLEQQPCQPAGSDTSGSAAANGQSERCAGTLPRTGSSTAGAVVAGTASVIVGLGLLASHRRRRAARMH